jgi:hypothetical protein
MEAAPFPCHPALPRRVVGAQLTCLRQVKAGMNKGKRCLQSRPRGPGTKNQPSPEGLGPEPGGRAPEVRHHTLRLFIRSVPGFSYLTALTRATYVVLPKENHIQLTEAATLDRKSGGSRPVPACRGGICSSADPSWKCFSTELA